MSGCSASFQFKENLWYWYNHTTVQLVIDFLLQYRYLPREVDPLVYNMSHEDPGNISYSDVGGLGEQIRELREVQLPWWA